MLVASRGGHVVLRNIPPLMTLTASCVRDLMTATLAYQTAGTASRLSEFLLHRYFIFGWNSFPLSGTND